MSQKTSDFTRRQLLWGAAASMAGSLIDMTSAQSQEQAQEKAIGADHGRVVPPVPMPAIPVQCADGRSASVAALVQGRATALHLMFTGCSTVCPIQGAVFQRVQQLLPDQLARGYQLLSLSIDPLGDTPAAMSAWLRRFKAQDGWIAAAPDPNDLDRILQLFGQGRNAVESHSTQVNIINRRGELVWRTPQLPSAESIADILRRV